MLEKLSEDIINPVGIYIKNQDLRERIHLILKTLQIKTEIIQNILENEKNNIIITDDERLKLQKKIFVNKNFIVSEIIREIKILDKFNSKSEKIIFGVDPGERIGIVALCQNKILETYSTVQIEDLLKWMKNILKITKISKLRVRIGKGQNYNKIIENMNLMENVNIVFELVDEKDTSSNKYLVSEKIYKGDIASAIIIGLRIDKEIIE